MRCAIDPLSKELNLRYFLQIPDDVDFRIMLTFLELYQTLMGFVMYKLYTDENIVYPPHLDVEKDDAGAGVGAITLSERSADVLAGRNAQAPAAEGAADASQAAAKITAKDVKKQIRAITKGGAAGAAEEEEQEQDASTAAAEEPASTDAFVEQASKTAAAAEASLKTLSELESANSAESSAFNIFSPYYFYISRECPRSLLEFVLRCFGASPERIGWDMVAGAGSALDEQDPRITHNFVDRPVNTSEDGENPYDGSRHPGSKRAYIQPQWLVDSANARKLLPTEPYAPGKVLPPHLSPFVDDEEVGRRGGYVPAEALAGGSGEAKKVDVEEESDDEEEEEDEEMEKEEEEAKEDAGKAASRPALAALLKNAKDAAALKLVAPDTAEAKTSCFPARLVTRNSVAPPSKKI